MEGLKPQPHGDTSKRLRYPSSNVDVDSSTELWDDDEVLCSCGGGESSIQLTLRSQLKEHQSQIEQFKEHIKVLELENIEKVELKYTLDEQKILLLEQENEIKRLEKLLEYHEEVIEKENALAATVVSKDGEIETLKKELNKLKNKLVDYSEVQSHNNDLQTELFTRDREVLTLKHSLERLRSTYLTLVKSNSSLEEKLIEQDGKHEAEKGKFENSIMTLTDKMIKLRKKLELLEQENAKAVRDCRLAVRLLQCSSPSSNDHAMYQQHKLSSIIDTKSNKSLSNQDFIKRPDTLKPVKQNSFEDESKARSSPTTRCPTPNASSSPTNPSGQDVNSSPIKKAQSTSCLESFYCVYNGNNSKTAKNLLQVQENTDTVLVLKDLLQGKKDAIHVLRVELGRREKEINVLRRKLTTNINESISNRNMDPDDRIRNLESRVTFLNDENFNLKYQLEICRKMLDRISEGGSK